jgi:hypothetical protein
MSVELKNCDNELTNQRVNKLLDTIKNTLNSEPLSFMNVVVVCFKLMQIVESFSGVTGENKKQMVIQALDTFVKNSGGDENMLQVIPSFIESAVNLANGKLTLSEVEEVGTKCCFGICSSVVSNKKAKN